MSNSDEDRTWRRLSFLEQVSGGAGFENVFVLGCFDTRATFRDQQVRAINLALSLGLAPAGANEILVIGGGVAGCTAAVALAAHGWTVTLIERHQSRVLDFQAACTHRYVHPNIYDWPHPQYRNYRAGLPWMDWCADSCDKVIIQLRTKWNQERARYAKQIKDPIFGVSRFIPTRTKDGKRWSVKLHKRTASNEDSGATPQEFDKIVVAVGFGEEQELGDGGSYWDKRERLDNLDAGTTVMISGDGDGALTDVVRGALQDFKHEYVLTLADDPLLEDIREKICLFERHESNPTDVVAFFNDLMQPDGVPQAFLDKLTNREGVRILLNCPRESALTGRSSTLNRFLVRCLMKIGRVEPWPGRLVIPKGGRWEMLDVTDEDARARHVYSKVEIDTQSLSSGIIDVTPRVERLVVRHGPTPVLKKAWETLWNANAHTHAERKLKTLSFERLRQPLWDERYLESLTNPPPSLHSPAAVERRTSKHSEVSGSLPAATPEAGGGHIREIIERFGMIGVAIDDSGIALMIISRELYGTAEPPEWWVHERNADAGLQVLRQVAEICEHNRQVRVLVVLDRFLPLSRGGDVVNWEGHEPTREHMYDVLEQLDVLEQMTERRVANNDDRVGVAVTSYPPGLVQDRSIGVTSRSHSIRWIHRSRHPFHELRKHLQEKRSALLGFGPARHGGGQPIRMMVDKLMRARDVGVGWILVTGSGMSRSITGSGRQSFVLPGQPRSARLYAEAAWMTFKSIRPDWEDPCPDPENRETDQRRETRMEIFDDAIAPHISPDTGLYRILSAYADKLWVPEDELGTLVPGPLDAAPQDAGFSDVLALDWGQGKATSLRFLEGLRWAISRRDQGHTHQHWAAAQFDFLGCLTTNFDYLHERARDYLRAQVRRGPGGRSTESAHSPNPRDWPILRLYDPGQPYGKLTQADVHWTPGGPAQRRTDAFVQDIKQREEGPRELGFLVVGHRLIDPTLWHAIKYVRDALNANPVRFMWVDPVSASEVELARVNEVLRTNAFGCKVDHARARALGFFYELAMNEVRLGAGSRHR